MQFTAKKRRRAPTVIIVSLIDVLLVVLIFLMVSTTFKKVQPVFKLALPEAQTSKPGATDAKPLEITIAAAAPHFHIGDRPVTFEQLQNRLEGEVQRDPHLRVAIRADKQAPWGEVLRVFDVATLAHVASLNFYTEKPSNP